MSRPWMAGSLNTVIIKKGTKPGAPEEVPDIDIS